MRDETRVVWIQTARCGRRPESILSLLPPGQIQIRHPADELDLIPAAVVISGQAEGVVTALKGFRRRHRMIGLLPAILLSSDPIDCEAFEAVESLREPLPDEELRRKLNFLLYTQDFYRFSLPALAVEGAEALSKSKDFLDSLIENLPNMVFVKEAKDLRFVRFNKAGEELLGYSRNELIGKNDFHFFPFEQAHFFTERDREVLNGKSTLEIAEEKILTKHRGERLLRTTKLPIFGADGKPEYLLGISEDVTELRRAEEAKLRIIREEAVMEEREHSSRRAVFLAEASMLLTSSFDYRRSLGRLAELLVPSFCDWCSFALSQKNALLDSVAVRGSFLVDRLGAVSRRHTDALFGRSPAEFVVASGKSFYDPVIPEVGSFLAVPITLRGKVLGAMLFANDVESRAFTFEDVELAEEIGRRAGIAIDNALLYETAQKAIQVRDEFLSIASHELKTPMTSLKLQIQMTRRAVDTKESKVPTAERLAKVLDMSAVQVNRLNALVDDLLDVSRIESGKLTYHFEEVELCQLVKEVVERYQDHLLSAGCAVTVNVATAVPVWGDRYRLEQVVLNLLSNAAKYGRGKPVMVEVSGAGCARISVRDSGIGIPSDKLDKVFERFERAAHTAHIGGLGLGLYISREIMRGHGGTIRCESELGGGSNFVAELPLAGEKAMVVG